MKLPAAEFRKTVLRARLDFNDGRGIGLQRIAALLGMVPSDYLRSENGQRRFTEEWALVAAVLDLPRSLRLRT